MQREPAACVCGDHVFAPLTKGYVTFVSPEDGYLLFDHKWYAKNSRYVCYANAGLRRDGVGITIGLHRQILADLPPKRMVDHINGNGLDNRRCNLRPASSAQNTAARMNRKRGRLGKIGVTQARGLYRVQVSILDTIQTIGSYETMEEACRYRDLSAQKLYGRFAVLNETLAQKEGKDRAPAEASGAWPAGCIKRNSCSRNKRCMYGWNGSCRHEDRSIGDEVAAAIAEKEGKDGPHR